MILTFMRSLHPPLLGDGQGNYRIHLVGNSGTGKSTLGAYLCGKLHIPHIPLDEIAWKPGWERTQVDEFKEKITTLMAQHTRGWIIDGDSRVLGTLIPDNATDIIWLDPPLYRYFPRLLWRTFMRRLGLSPTCAEGCRETCGEFYLKRGIIRSCLTDHSIARTKYAAWRSRMGVEVGGKLIRLDEFRGELAEWKECLEHHVRQM